MTNAARSEYNSFNRSDRRNTYIIGRLAAIQAYRVKREAAFNSIVTIIFSLALYLPSDLFR
jgi:hypothetical protein